jgi:biotin carboxyl carrier protein
MSRYRLIVDDEPITVEIDRGGQVRINGRAVAVDLYQIGDRSLYNLLVGGISHEAFAFAEGDTQYVVIGGQCYSVRSADDAPITCLTDICPEDKAEIRAPMPGVIVSIVTQVGQCLSRQDLLLTLESMKMEMQLKSPIEGVVTALSAEPGDQVSQGQTLAVVERLSQ